MVLALKRHMLQGSFAPDPHQEDLPSGLLLGELSPGLNHGSPILIIYPGSAPGENKNNIK